MLKHHVRSADVGRFERHIAAADEDTPAVGKFKAADEPQECGLTTPARSENREKLAPAERQVDPRNGRDCAELLSNIRDLNGMFAASLVRLRARDRTMPLRRSVTRVRV